MNEKDLYARIADEIGTNTMDPALWTQAFAEADGHNDRAKAIYIRLRRAELLPATGLSANEPDRTLATADHDPMQKLRSELGAALERSRRGSLYRTLKLAPTCADHEIAAAIEAIRGERVGPDAEVRYAVEVLGDPQARADYDRRLAAEFGIPAGRFEEPSFDGELADDDAPSSVFMQWWATRKVTLLVVTASLVLLGYMLNAFYLTSSLREQQIEQASLQKSQLEHNVDLARQREERARLAEQRRAEYATESANQRAQRLQEQAFRSAQNEVRQQQYAYQALQERERREKERLLAAERNRQRQAEYEAQQARQRADREAAYWACFNDAMDRRDSTYATQYCERYRR